MSLFVVSSGSAGICEIGCRGTHACTHIRTHTHREREKETERGTRQHVTFKTTPGPKPACRIEKCTAQVLWCMHALIFLGQITQMRVQCWIIKDDKFGCKQFLQTERWNAYSEQLFIIGWGSTMETNVLLHWMLRKFWLQRTLWH